jgi:hypothetical protein
MRPCSSKSRRARSLSPFSCFQSTTNAGRFIFACDAQAPKMARALRPLADPPPRRAAGGRLASKARSRRAHIGQRDSRVRRFVPPAGAAVPARRDPRGGAGNRPQDGGGQHPLGGRASRVQSARAQGEPAQPPGGAGAVPGHRAHARGRLAGARAGARPSAPAGAGLEPAHRLQPGGRRRPRRADRPEQAALRAGAAEHLARDHAAPPAPGAVGARRRLGRDQPAGARDPDLPDDRVQQGDQPRRAADARCAGARHDHAVLVRVGVAGAPATWRAIPAGASTPRSAAR